VLVLQFTLPKNVSKVWTLKPHERQWLEERQVKAKRVAKEKNAYHGTILGELMVIMTLSV
jgi:hypothetical protein